MRRLLIILMLTLLPLQAGWAAVCAYCPDNCISELASGVTAEAVDDDNDLGGNDECGRCQMGGVGIASSPAVSGIVPHLNTFAALSGNIFSDSGQPDRPERPNWTRAA